MQEGLMRDALLVEHEKAGGRLFAGLTAELLGGGSVSMGLACTSLCVCEVMVYTMQSWLLTCIQMSK